MCEIFVTVGRLGRSRGVRGELYVIPDTDFPQRFLSMRELHLRTKDGWEKIKIDSTRMVSGRPVIKLEGVDTPEDAARYTNREIGVPQVEVVKLPEGSFWIHDLVGCEVIDESTGSVMGEVTAVETYPANDVYMIRTIEGDELSIAAVEKFVKRVDISKKKVVVDTTGLVKQ